MVCHPVLLHCQMKLGLLFTGRQSEMLRSDFVLSQHSQYSSESDKSLCVPIYPSSIGSATKVSGEDACAFERGALMVV
jgi:hypothetical protein